MFHLAILPQPPNSVFSLLLPPPTPWAGWVMIPFLGIFWKPGVHFEIFPLHRAPSFLSFFEMTHAELISFRKK